MADGGRAAPLILHRVEIEEILCSIDLVPAIEAAFVDGSTGRIVLPPVGELLLERGEVHIKYGYRRGDDTYVVKVASGFPGNPERGLASGNGCMLVFRAETGELGAVLIDEGHLTDVRTAVAGAVVAKHLAPPEVERIGIVGTGLQARMQLEYLRLVLPDRDALVWGRDRAKAEAYAEMMASRGVRVGVAATTDEIVDRCQLVVTATSASAPLVQPTMLHPGLHITAVGADAPGKNELAPRIFGRADRVIADHLGQCLERGEIHHAVAGGVLDPTSVVELGNVVAGTQTGRTRADEITVADLTGVAVQDIAIAQAVVAAARADGGTRRKPRGPRESGDEVGGVARGGLPRGVD